VVSEISSSRDHVSESQKRRALTTSHSQEATVLRRVVLVTLPALLLATLAFAQAPAAPAKGDKAPLKAPPETPALIEQGKAAYAIHCLMCHGENGDGKGPAGVALQPPPRNFSTDPFKQGSSVEEIFTTLSTGVPGTAMVPYVHLPEADRWAISYFVKGYVPKAPPAKKSAPSPKK
jgi:mono/diheme cytochrome c family protein